MAYASVANAATAMESGIYRDIRNSKIYVETIGTGPPILFLHGGLLYFDNSFAKQRDYFSSFRKVIGFDGPGHGHSHSHSPDNGKPFSYREMAEDTAAVIEKLGIGPVDVVGHSDGANIGLILAHDHPALVRRLVISGANIRASLPADEFERRKHWSQEQTAEKLRQFDQQLPPHFRTDYEAVAPKGEANWQYLLAKSYALWLTPVVIEPAELKSIQAPVLVIAGDKDLTSIEATLEIFHSLPHAQLFIVSGTGHGTFIERPDLMNQVVREFLEKQ